MSHSENPMKLKGQPQTTLLTVKVYHVRSRYLQLCGSEPCLLSTSEAATDEGKSGERFILAVEPIPERVDESCTEVSESPVELGGVKDI